MSRAMANRFGVSLHPDDVRWATAEGLSETIIAAVLLLHERSVDEIVPRLSAVELEQVIKLIGRSPRPARDALKNKLSLIVPRIVLLVVPKTSATVWVLILLFGTPTATTTLLTTLAAFVTTLVLTTLATLTPLLAGLILTLILRHHYLPSWDFPR